MTAGIRHYSFLKSGKSQLTVASNSIDHLAARISSAAPAVAVTSMPSKHATRTSPRKKRKSKIDIKLGTGQQWQQIQLSELKQRKGLHIDCCCDRLSDSPSKKKSKEGPASNSPAVTESTICVPADIPDAVLLLWRIYLYAICSRRLRLRGA